MRSARVARAETQHQRRKRRLYKFLFIILIVGAAWAVYAAWSQRTIHIKYVWVQMLPDEDQLRGGRLARAIIPEGDRCPKVLEDGHDVNMVRRPSPLQAAFPVLICEAKIEGTSDAWIGSRHLPKRPGNPQDVVVIGDTGCRMVYYQTQPCHSGVEWPFAAVAVSAAAKIQTDGFKSIIIHVGDYHYRENPCADQSPECGGSPYGDNWATWEEEFFKPASPLLLAAPWVIMRGNHEDCGRAGAGWIFFFALPGSTGDKACQHELPSYRLAIGQAGQRQRVLVVLDTANAGSPFDLEDRCETFRRWIDGINDGASIVWLALHQPLLSSPRNGRRNDNAGDDSCLPNKTPDAYEGIRARLLGSTPKPKVKLLLSGDTHLFQYFEPVDHDKPVQIIAGNGGTALEPPEKSSPNDTTDRNAKSDDKALAWNAKENFFDVKGGTLTIRKHGFVTMHNDGQTWTVALLDVTGRTLATCHFSETSDPSPQATALPDCNGNPGRQATAQ